MKLNEFLRHALSLTECMRYSIVYVNSNGGYWRRSSDSEAASALRREVDGRLRASLVDTYGITTKAGELP